MEDAAISESGGIVSVGGTQERETTQAAVARLISGARAGRGGALFVVGEAGLGKTTILDQARELACPGVRIGWGCGDVMEASLPFGLFAAVLDTVDGPRDLLHLPTTGPRGGDVQAGRFGAVLRWLEDTAAQPVLLVLDDLHWADLDSLAIMSFLARRIRRLPVAVLGALRPWPPAANELAAALVYDGYAAVERLAPLSRDAAAELLSARLGGPVSGAVSRTALELCGGNPLLLEQVAAAIGRGEDVVAPPTRTGRAASRAEIVLTRFAGVPKVAIRCAQAASVLGTRFRPELAVAVAQLNDQETDIALDALCRSGLVRSETEMAAEFVHPLFRQALYDDLAVPVRARLHARAFTALTARGLYGEAVDHAIRADLAGDDGAIRAMTRAGMAALRSGAPTLATRHLRAAARAAGSRAGADLLMALAESLLVAGRPAEAIPVCDRLRGEQELTSARRVKVLRMLGRAFSATGAHNDSTTCFAQAAELAEAHDPAVAIEVLSDAALASWISAGPGQSLPLAERAYTLATNAKTSLLNRAASVWGYLAFLSGDPQGLIESEAGAGAVEAEDLASLSDLCWSWDALSTFSIAATFAERFNDAQHVLDVLASAAERIDIAGAISGLVVTQAIVAARQGRLAEAFGFAERASSPVDLLPAQASQAGSIRAEVLHQMGRGAEAMEWCDRIEPDATARGESSTLLRVWNIRGQHLLRGGRSEAASELYVQLEELSGRMGIGEPCWIPWARHAITAHLSACRTPDARRVIAWLDRSAARLPCRYPRIAAATGRASLAEAEGDYEATEGHFNSALALHEQVPLPLERVETLLAYGAFLRRRGRPCRARPLLAEAVAIAEANQAGWLAEQVREELTVAGGRRHRSRSLEETTRLTMQEQRVARLAAAGHSNRAIAGKLTLSVKTIEYHLQQVYAKLGISSRRQLMTGQHDGKGSRREKIVGR
jgi:DNA-binding CsgD family transcriptional regulator